MHIVPLPFGKSVLDRPNETVETHFTPGGPECARAGGMKAQIMTERGQDVRDHGGQIMTAARDRWWPPAGMSCQFLCQIYHRDKSAWRCIWEEKY